MNEYKYSPTRWYYLLALLIPLFVCVGTSMLVFRSIPDLPGALESLGIESLTHVIVPGSAEIDFPKAGAYAVYYEYRSVIDGVSYYRDEYPPSIRCQLRSKVTGEEVRFAPSNVQGDVYTYPERAGVLFKRVSIDRPGIYNFSCHYPDGRSYPKNVLAVGPNYLLEFFNFAAKPVAVGIVGSLAFMGASVLSLVIIVVVASKRHQSKKILASQA